jgi:hypothetical protein
MNEKTPNQELRGGVRRVWNRVYDFILPQAQKTRESQIRPGNFVL